MVINAEVIHISGGIAALFDETLPKEVVALTGRRIGKLVRQQTTITVRTSSGGVDVHQSHLTPRLNAPMIQAEEAQTLPADTTAYVEIKASGVTLYIEKQ